VRVRLDAAARPPWRRPRPEWRVFGWLARVGEREAWRLVAKDESHPVGDARDHAAFIAGPRTLEELALERDQLSLVERLPERKRRILVLHSVGYSYEEVGAITGDTPRTVERQLRRAKRLLRDARDDPGEGEPEATEP
jgi:DNA-directed RNA polymerase specialized sigma24 family protein